MSDPVRTCVACRTRQPQRALLRLRRRSDGVVVPAVGRRTHGRSAYLCPRTSCLEQAVRRRALERSLGRTGAGESNGARVHPIALEALRPMVMAALDQEIQTLQRSGDIRRSPRYDALDSLRRGLLPPGRSA